MKNGALLIITLSLSAGGFLPTKGSLYIKFDSRFESTKDAFNEQGERMAGEDVAIFNEIETWKHSLFAQYGFHDRFALSAYSQYVSTTLDHPSLGKQSGSGVSDLWLKGHVLLHRGSGSLVLNFGGKIPLEKNDGNFPQISSGEPTSEVSLGYGRGWTGFFAEADLGYRFRSGNVQDGAEAAVAYEDEWFLDLKAGMLRGKWLFQAFSQLTQTRADLNGSSFVPGIYTNSDKLNLHLSAEREWNQKLQLGLSFGQTINGKNALKERGLSLFLAYKK